MTSESNTMNPPLNPRANDVSLRDTLDCYGLIFRLNHCRGTGTLHARHYAIDTTGVAPVVKQAVQGLRPLGQCAIVGFTGEVTFKHSARNYGRRQGIDRRY